MWHHESDSNNLEITGLQDEDEVSDDEIIGNARYD